MRTTINGLSAEWPAIVLDLFLKHLPELKDSQSVESANFYTPKPAVDEWNRGRKDAGFAYVLWPGPHVCTFSVPVEEWMKDPEWRP